MFQISVINLEACNHPSKKVGSLKFEQNLLKKSSPQEANRTHRRWSLVPCPNLYSTEVVKTYASRLYNSFKFLEIHKRNHKNLRRTKDSNWSFLASGALSKPLFQ